MGNQASRKIIGLNKSRKCSGGGAGSCSSNSGCSDCCFVGMQETLVAECDLGRDYEHCLELQKKVNDTEAVSDNDDDDDV